MTTTSDKLLVQIGFTGAMYGLSDPVLAIANYLMRRPETQVPAYMIVGQLMIAQKNYVEAIKVFEQILAKPEFEKFHPEATAFKGLVEEAKQVSALAAVGLQ